jgi:hypothetical protein
VSADHNSKRIDALERLLSLERLSRYTALANADRIVALAHYERNTRLSEALYTPLQGLEVCLRNALSIELMKFLGADWYDNQHGIFEHPLTEMLGSAQRSLAQEGKAIILGRMVAELNLGFWASILSPRYENTLWRERKQVHKAINAVRRLRNRVAHHEPILHRDLRSDFALIVAVISWACPHTAAWVEEQSRVIAVISN